MAWILCGVIAGAGSLLAGCHDDVSPVASAPPVGNSSSSGASSSGSSSGATPPVPAANASFTAAASTTAGAAVAFDASASTSSDGSALSYFWDFGDGAHGGGKTIAHVFSAVGSPSVTLTVLDAASVTAKTSKSITVSAAAAALTTTTIEVLVSGLDGTAIGGVSVTPGGGTAALTDSSGKATVTVGVGVPVTLKLGKTGYAGQVLTVNLPAGSGTDGYFPVVMRTRDAPVTLADVAAGGTLNGRDGVTMILPPQGLVDATGAPVTGPASIAMTPVDVTQTAAGGFPGQYAGIQQDGTSTLIVSQGTTEFILGSDAARLQLAPGKTATIQLPIYAAKRPDGTVVAAGDTVPLWSLDEQSGLWIQEGVGTVIASSGSPSGFALQASVSHFSYWNSDLIGGAAGATPKCVYDTDIGVPGAEDTFNTATICNMLAQFDQGAGSGSASAPPSTGVSKAQRYGAGRALRPRIHAVTPVNPLVAAFSATATVSIASGGYFAVPTNAPLKITAYALNGTWTGETSYTSGAAGTFNDVTIKMHPLYDVSGGGAAEAITLPFDAVRAFSADRPDAQFTFTAADEQWAKIAVSLANSVFDGQVRLLQGTTVLATAPFNTNAQGTFMVHLPNAGTYTIDVSGAANQAGSFELKASLLGGVQSGSLGVPDYQTYFIPQYMTQRSTFTLSAATTLNFSFLESDATQGSEVSVLASDGSTAVTPTPPATAGAPYYKTQTLNAGTYTLQVRPANGAQTSIQVGIDKTRWLEVSPGIPTFGPGMVDLVADRNNALVVGVVNSFNNNGHTSFTLMLRRFVAGAWETVGADTVIDQPCTDAGNAVAFAFDTANNPVIVYGSHTTAGGPTVATVQRFANGAWAAVGPGGGVLPMTSTASGACYSRPVIQIGADNVPVVGYRSDNNIVVQHFDGSAWQGLANAATGDTFAAQSLDFDLKLDPSNRAWIVLGAADGTHGPLVQRFNSSTSAWETIGTGLTQTGTIGLEGPHLRFDGTGSPVLTFVAYVGSSGTSSPGLAVYRFDGSHWSTTGGFQTVNGSGSGSGDDLSVTLAGGQALVAWVDNIRSDGSFASVVALANTASGYTPVGDGTVGQIPQYDVHNAIRYSAAAPRLVAIGSDVYLAAVISTTTGVGFVPPPPPQIVLLKEVAN